MSLQLRIHSSGRNPQLQGNIAQQDVTAYCSGPRFSTQGCPSLPTHGTLYSHPPNFLRSEVVNLPSMPRATPDLHPAILCPLLYWVVGVGLTDSREGRHSRENPSQVQGPRQPEVLVRIEAAVVEPTESSSALRTFGDVQDTCTGAT